MKYLTLFCLQLLGSHFLQQPLFFLSDLKGAKQPSKLECSTYLVKDLASIMTDDNIDVYSSMESLSRYSNATPKSSDDTSTLVPYSEADNQTEDNPARRKSIGNDDGEKNPAQGNAEDFGSNEGDENIADETDVGDETDMEVANETDNESVKSTSVYKKSTAIKNIFRNTLAKNKPTLKIKLKKQDIIDKESIVQPMSLRQHVVKNGKKCCFGCKDKKIIAKEEPKSKVLSKLKIFNRSKYNNIVESPKSGPQLPFIKKLKLRNAPPKEINESNKVKPIKLILKRNTNDEFASSRGPAQSDIESDIENITRDPPDTNRKSQTSRYSEDSVLKDLSPVKENCSDGSPNTESEPLHESPKILEPFDPEKEFECSDDSESEAEELAYHTCAHCNIFGTQSKKELISHYTTCNSLCPSVICDPVTSKEKKIRCTYCKVYTSSSKTMLRNHLKACRCKPVAQRGRPGRPRKIIQVKETDSCKFCNFKHPDVNVFLRHLRFCNAASAPNVTTTQTEQATAQMHKCSSCNYVNTNLNIFMYHLKLCNKNYNNLSLKDMLLKYKERPNIIGYSKQPTSSEVKTCDSIKNIPSSSKEILHSGKIDNANVCNENIVQKQHHVPSMFDPIEEDDYTTGYDSIPKYSEYNENKDPRESSEKVNQSTDSSNLAEQSIPPVNDEYSNQLARIKPLELSESSCSETTMSHHKSNVGKTTERNAETQFIVEEPDNQIIIVQEEHNEISSRLDIVPVSEEIVIHEDNGLEIEKEETHTLDNQSAEIPPVVESTDGPGDDFQNNLQLKNSGLTDVPFTGIHESSSHLEINVPDMNLDSSPFETLECQITTAPDHAVQSSLESTDEQGNIPNKHSICTAQHTEENILEEKTLQLETNVLQVPISLEAVTNETSSELHYATSIFTESLVHYSEDNIGEGVKALSNEALNEVISEDAPKASSEEKVIQEDGELGPRRLSFEHFENIASSYYAGHSNSEDEIEDELIRIDPNEELKNKEEIEFADANVKNDAADLTPEIMDNDLNTDLSKVITDHPENYLTDDKVKNTETGDILGSVDETSMIIDFEDSNDGKEVELKLDLGSIHDSLLDAKALSPTINPSDGEGTLSQVSSIPKDESIDRDNAVDDVNTVDDVDSIQNDDIDENIDDSEEDDEEFDSQRTCLNCRSFESDDVNVLIAHIKECSNVNSDDESDEVDSEETDIKNNAMDIPQNSEAQNCVVSSVEKSERAIENVENNLEINSRKRKLSQGEDHHPLEDEVVFKIPKTINPVKVFDSEARDIEVMDEENEIQRDEAMVDVSENVTDEVTPGTMFQLLTIGNEPTGINESAVGDSSNQDGNYDLQNERTSEVENMENINQDGAEDSELFCSHCNQFSTFEVDELLNHFKQCTAVINESGATPYISSEINELASKYDGNNCKQIINAKYTNILLNKEHHTLTSAMQSCSSPAGGSMTPTLTGETNVHPAESPRYMTELTSVVSSDYILDDDPDPDDTRNNNDEGNQS